MGANLKYLFKRGNCWYIDVRLPKKFGGKRIRQSLGTEDEKTACNMRDKYIVPVLLSDNAMLALEEISKSCMTILSESEKNIASIKNIGQSKNALFLYEAIQKYIEFIQSSNLRKKTIQSYTSAMNKMMELFADCTLTMINKDMAVTARDSMINGDGTNKIGPTRTKFNFQVWRGFLRWTRQQGYVDYDMDKMLYIPLPKVRKKPTSYIPEENADKATLLLHNWTLAPRIARYTGMRLMEVLSMTQDLIVKRHGIKCFHVTEEISKTGKERFVPIADKLLPYINDLSELAKTGKKNDKYNREIKKITGCEKCSFHSWRVYANTQMMQAGIDDTVRKRVVGHKDGKDEIHAGYTYVRLEEMKKAVDLIK